MAMYIFCVCERECLGVCVGISTSGDHLPMKNQPFQCESSLKGQ